MKNKLIMLLTMLLMGMLIISCGKKTQPAEPNDDVDLSSLLGPEAKDSTDVNLSELAKEKGAEPEVKTQKEKDPVVGMFICKKTNDQYFFDDDGTGIFFSGGSNTKFKWQRKDDMVILTYEAFGKEYLLFDPKKKTLKENSETLGVLIFNKI